MSKKVLIIKTDFVVFDVLSSRKALEATLNSKKESNIMKNILIEYPKCSTCQKAKKWLETNNIAFVDRNIITETPSIEEITEWIEKSEQEIRKWFNTSGLKYKELNLKEKLPTMSDKEKIKLLASDGMLIKRPIFISSKGIVNGFQEAKWKEII